MIVEQSFPAKNIRTYPVVFEICMREKKNGRKKEQEEEQQT